MSRAIDNSRLSSEPVSSRGTTPQTRHCPNQADLARQFGVNVGTVRKAIAVLEAEGLVTPIAGRDRCFVHGHPCGVWASTATPKSNWKFGGLVAFAADREATGRPWSVGDQTQTVRRVPADEAVAAAFRH